MRRLITAVLALLVVACGDDGGIIDIDDRTGAVRGTAYVDRNADGAYSPGADAVAVGVSAALVLDATGDTVARSTSQADGSFAFSDVPIGRYRLVASRGALGDSVVVQPIAAAVFSLAHDDTVSRDIGFGYPGTTTAEALAMPAGRRIIIDGIALNGWSLFGDSTVHVSDATGAIRAVRVQQSTAQEGDSVRLLGVTGVADGRAVIADGTLRVLTAAAGLPPIDSVSTLAAATAVGGTHVNGQVRVAGAIIQDTSRVGGDIALEVDDGSGTLVVVLDSRITFTGAPYVPGASFSGSGVLVPASSGTGWQMKPRAAAEVTITFPAITVAAARSAPAGLRVTVHGIALNSWTAFGDSTVHLRDASGHIRSVRVASPVAAGDSIRMIGTTAVRDGQPVLTAVTPAVLQAGVGIGAPDSVPTATAGDADGGDLDAAFVRIGGQIVSAQTLPNGDMIVGVNDGSGRLDVLLDDAIPFASSQFQSGAILNAVGVLVPVGNGTWQLKPRSVADASATFPTVTIAQARGLTVGQTVNVIGVALNSWVTFGDASVHLADASDVIRTIGVPQSSLLAGDSIRILGTVAMRNGQPVLNASNVSVLLAGVGMPAIDSVDTAVAASAEDGERDADHVAVSGVISAAAVRGADYVLTIDDGTGELTVVLDADVGFATGNYEVGDNVRVRGVLVPGASGIVWELKPRATNEIAVNSP